jgi:23S rRNA pseudouridine1911/1915/1917 synthase
LKYGYPRSNPDASISLHAWHIAFEHPVSKAQIEVKAPLPKVSPWTAFEQIIP